MGTMIERVARAMAEEMGENWDSQTYRDTATGQEPEEQRDYWRAAARAAIEAMRDPSSDILAEGVSEFGYSDDAEDEVERIYRVMIDAALSEDET